MFDAIAVVDIDVNVEDSRVMKEQLEDGKDDIVNIAKSRSFSLFSMVKPPDQLIAMSDWRFVSLRAASREPPA